jgi:hypothetical protein
LSKKLKKKIEEICGLHGLDWETRQNRAGQILASSEWKQSLCNELLGLSFRELERTLNGIVSERLNKEDSYQRKLDLYNEGKINKKPKEPMLRDSPKPSAPSNVKSPPRTLEQILAQVHAPRVVQEREVPGSDWYLEFRWSGEDSTSGCENGSKVQPNASDVDYKSDK